MSKKERHSHLTPDEMKDILFGGEGNNSSLLRIELLTFITEINRELLIRGIDPEIALRKIEADTTLFLNKDEMIIGGSIGGKIIGEQSPVTKKLSEATVERWKKMKW